MTPRQILEKLDWAQVDGSRDALTRRMMRDEAENLRVALHLGGTGRIDAAAEEAVRVARMYGVMPGNLAKARGDAER